MSNNNNSSKRNSNSIKYAEGRSITGLCRFHHWHARTPRPPVIAFTFAYKESDSIVTVGVCAESVARPFACWMAAVYAPALFPTPLPLPIINDTVDAYTCGSSGPYCAEEGRASRRKRRRSRLAGSHYARCERHRQTCTHTHTRSMTSTSWFSMACGVCESGAQTRDTRTKSATVSSLDFVPSLVRLLLRKSIEIHGIRPAQPPRMQRRLMSHLLTPRAHSLLDKAWMGQ